MAAEVSAPEKLAGGFLDYARYRVKIGDSTQTRDIVRAGSVAALIAIDPARDVVVLLRQFRLAAHLATGRGELVEIVAGRIEKDESAIDAARRECEEEIGLTPTRVVELFSVLSTPGITDEFVTFFLGVVDATHVPEAGPDASEGTRPFVVPIDDALAAMARGDIQNALAVSALQWLALHRDEFKV